MAMANRELTTAEMAYAAIGEVRVTREVFHHWKDGQFVKLACPWSKKKICKYWTTKRSYWWVTLMPVCRCLVLACSFSSTHYEVQVCKMIVESHSQVIKYGHQPKASVFDDSGK